MLGIVEVVVMGVKENMKLMMTLDDAWNNQDWETFKKRHAANVAVYWPGQAEPTRGREAHYRESVEFFKTFDNKLVNNPYKILFGDGNYTCSVADWTATMIGPMKGPDGKIVQPTHKTARLEFCTVATWKNSEITEERLFYDVVGMMRQLGLM
jgi:hypothetical protein